ncbi:hypothetical protein V8C35DRAFT_196830 [Trichoderma chlorosporum]
MLILILQAYCTVLYFIISPRLHNCTDEAHCVYQSMIFVATPHVNFVEFFFSIFSLIKKMKMGTKLVAGGQWPVSKNAAHPPISCGSSAELLITGSEIGLSIPEKGVGFRRTVWVCCLSITRTRI